MNILIDELPNTVNIEGLDYLINTDFRIGIMFEQLMQDKKVTDEQKLELAIGLYLKNKVRNKAESVQKILWFYSCGHKEKANRGGSGALRKAIYDYNEDAEYIYSAFLQQYNVDLQDASLHWWKFKAMMQGLKDCRFTEIMGYRSVNLKDVPECQRNFYTKMKRLYALPDNRTEEEKEQMIADAFSF